MAIGKEAALTLGAEEVGVSSFFWLHTGHVFALHMLTGRFCQCLLQSVVSVCWECHSLVVSRAVVYFVFSLKLILILWQGLFNARHCTNHSVYINSFILHKVTFMREVGVVTISQIRKA